MEGDNEQQEVPGPPIRGTKRFSYSAKHKRQVIVYAEEHENRKAAKQFTVPETCVRRWRAQKTAIFKCESSRKRFSGPKQGRYPEIDEAVLQWVQERRKDALPVTYDLMRMQANTQARNRGIPAARFKASLGWVQRFMRRSGLALRRRTSICQKLPANFEHQLREFQKYVINLRTRGNFPMGHIGNADETPIYLDMPYNYTVHEKGAKQVQLKTTGCEKLRITVMLGGLADGRKLPPFLILKRKTLPKKLNFPPDVVVRVQSKGWMTEELMIDWLQTVWGRRPGALLNLNSMLCLDAFRGHLTDGVKSKLQRMKSELVVIPAGMTSVLQPMDVCINKPFKDRLKKIYAGWLSDPARELTPSGKIKRAPPVARWVSRAWKAIPEEIMARAFKKCCISNNLDGTEDDVLWEDNCAAGEASGDNGVDEDESDDSEVESFSEPDSDLADTDEYDE